MADTKIERIEEKVEELERGLPKEDKEELDKLRDELKATWPKILSEITADEEYIEAAPAIRWLKHVLEKNVPFGKHNRALGGALFYRQLRPVRTEEEDFDTYVLGWCLEIFQTASLIADDIMDGSETRRGSPCWYLVDGVGMSAVNDCFLLENFVYEILHKYFRNKEFYHPLVRLLQKTAYRTILGQNLDTRIGLDKNINDFNDALYSTIVKYKTSYYSFCAPMQSALILAGVKDPIIHDQMEKLMIEFGEYFQIQDDFLDCYGNPAVTGKIGTDIIDGKCTWLFVQAMKIASEDEAHILMENYGQPDPMKEAKVKEIYKLLEVEKIYNDYEYTTYNSLMRRIRSLPPSIPKKPIRQMLQNLYQRTK